MPVLGMKFENPQQLKNALADYGVAHGYQLWYYRSDSQCLLVYCGRDVELGRCAGIRGIKKLKKENENREGTPNGKGAKKNVESKPKKSGLR